MPTRVQSDTVYTCNPPMNPPIITVHNNKFIPLEIPSQINVSKVPKKTTLYRIINNKGQIIANTSVQPKFVSQAKTTITPPPAIIVPNNTTVARSVPTTHRFSFMRRHPAPSLAASTTVTYTTINPTPSIAPQPQPDTTAQPSHQLNNNKDCRQKTHQPQQNKVTQESDLPPRPPQLTLADLQRFRDSNLSDTEAKRVLDIIATQQSYDSLLAERQRQREIAAAQQFVPQTPLEPPFVYPNATVNIPAPTKVPLPNPAIPLVGGPYVPPPMYQQPTPSYYQAPYTAPLHSPKCHGRHGATDAQPHPAPRQHHRNHRTRNAIHTSPNIRTTRRCPSISTANRIPTHPVPSSPTVLVPRPDCSHYGEHQGRDASRIPTV